MAKFENPDKLGVIWINEGSGKGAGKKFFGGSFFMIGDGVSGCITNCDIRYFKYDKNGKTIEGIEIIKVAEIGHPESGKEEAPF